MAVTLEKIYEVAIRGYHMQLKAGEKGLSRLVDWVHMVEEMDYIQFLKGRELIVTTGIIMPEEGTLLTFVNNICEAGASGLVINTGRYIKEVPNQLIEFANSHDFPIFVIPWEVHLVEFNRELCNLIYQAEREQDNLEGAVKKLIFSKEDRDGSMQVLAREGMAADSKVRLVQCYIPVLKEEVSQDTTQLSYQFQRYCQQVLTSTKKKYVLFYEDYFLTMVLFEVTEQEVDEILENIRQFQGIPKTTERMYFAVSAGDTNLENLWEKYKKTIVLCKKAQLEKESVGKEEDAGVWNILLDIEDQSRLKKYEEQILGELKHLDEETGTDYSRILEIYLEENGNIQEVASKCFLHRNTVSAHLKKITEITGRNLSDAGDRNQLYLAFQIRKILSLM